MSGRRVVCVCTLQHVREPGFRCWRSQKSPITPSKMAPEQLELELRKKRIVEGGDKQNMTWRREKKGSFRRFPRNHYLSKCPSLLQIFPPMTQNHFSTFPLFHFSFPSERLVFECPPPPAHLQSRVSWCTEGRIEDIVV